MHPSRLARSLRFYFITDHQAPALSALDQVRAALQGGAGCVQYRNKTFQLSDYEEVRRIHDVCRTNGVPLVINDNVLLARAVGADGVHLGQTDADPGEARAILGPAALIGVSISTPAELRQTDLGPCDYVGSGPVFATGTKADAKPVRGLDGLAEIVRQVPLPVVAIGGITDARAGDCLRAGAAGVAVISAVSRATNPLDAASRLGTACGCRPRRLEEGWQDEFGLIRSLVAPGLEAMPFDEATVPPGDDAALLAALACPVITTDTQREGVHFQSDWFEPETLGERAVEVTLSDLAACYARPVSLFVNLGLPKALSETTIRGIYKGIYAALERNACRLGGGNISRAEGLALDLFAVGEGLRDRFPRRGAARAGDGLYATGPLGLARCGLLALQKGDERFPDLVQRFRQPRARFDASEILAANDVRCVMDISDGLAGDAAHIAEASSVTIALDPSGAACHEGIRAFCDVYDLSPAETVLAGGEDYELLFACPEDRFAALQPLLPQAVRVGTCQRFDGAPLRNVPPHLFSFQHGKAWPAR
jgi:thiamine-monophosphate kinase